MAEAKFFPPLRAERDALRSVSETMGAYVSDARDRLGCHGGTFGWDPVREVFVWHPLKAPSAPVTCSPAQNVTTPADPAK